MGSETAKAAEFARVIAILQKSGVPGASDFANFVNDTTSLRPSAFDFVSAATILVELLPTISDAHVAATAASRLRGRWAKPDGFVVVRDAFVRWAPISPSAGWTIGDVVGTLASHRDTKDVIQLCSNESYGQARQMIVYSLYRHRADSSVEALLRRLIHDESVALHAMSSLRRIVGAVAMLEVVESLAESDPNESIRDQAKRETAKLSRVIAQRAT